MQIYLGEERSRDANSTVPYEPESEPVPEADEDTEQFLSPDWD
jgi:hypothetical protein